MGNTAVHSVSTIGASCIKLQPDYLSFPFDLPFPSGVFRQHPIYLTRMPRDSPAGAEVPQLIPNVSPDDRSLTLHASCHQAFWRLNLQHNQPLHWRTCAEPPVTNLEIRAGFTWSAL